MIITKVNNYTAPAKDAQGTQRVLEALTKELIRQGHTVNLLINPGSVPKQGTLVNTIPDDTDIVHYHGGFPIEYGHHHNFKWVSTAHGGAIDTEERLQEVKKYVNNLIFVSNFCSRMYDSDCYIHNCIDEDDFVFKEKKDDYFLWMAGTDWEEQKGLFTSIRLAKKLGFKLKIAGGGKNLAVIEEIKRNCDRKIEYLGFVNGKEKSELLAGAKALFMLGNILDACPVTSIESLASGTPIIAKNVAVHPEIVKDGVGFLCNNEVDMCKAILNIGKINTKYCREYYQNNFSLEVITKKYLKIYQNMINSGNVFGR